MRSAAWAWRGRRLNRLPSTAAGPRAAITPPGRSCAPHQHVHVLGHRHRLAAGLILAARQEVLQEVLQRLCRGTDRMYERPRRRQKVTAGPLLHPALTALRPKVHLVSSQSAAGLLGYG